MTPDDRDPRPQTPAGQRAREAVSALGTPSPDEGFRARLRERFVSGEIAAGTEVAGPPRRRRVIPLVPAFGLAAAAALAWMVWSASGPPHWTWEGVSGGEGELWICGKLMDPDDGEAIQAMLHPGTPVKTTGELQADLRIADRIALQVAPGAELDVPTWPRRWGGSAATCDVTRGEVRFTTGPRYAARLEIRAPLATIEVTGTTLAVIASPDSSCVCVLEGQVLMTGPDGSAHPVGAGKRRTVFREGPAREEEILPMERMKLEMVRDSARP